MRAEMQDEHSQEEMRQAQEKLSHTIHSLNTSLAVGKGARRFKQALDRKNKLRRQSASKNLLG
jgi:uncharacterized protein (UPF0548 family)